MMTELYLSMLLRQFSVERIRQTLREAKRVISRFRPVTSDLVNFAAPCGREGHFILERDMADDKAPRYDDGKAASPPDGITNARREQEAPASQTLWNNPWSAVQWGDK